MPPLRFDAAASLAPPPKPETILLLRDARVQSGAVFHGTVIAIAATPAATAPAGDRKIADSKVAIEEKNTSFGSRVRNFFRRLFGGKPKST